MSEDITLHHKLIILGLDKAGQDFENAVPISSIRARSLKDSADKWECITQAGQLVSEIIDLTNEDDSIHKIYLSFSMECIQGITGVST